MKDLSFYVKYERLGASSRLRYYQFIPKLCLEYKITSHALLSNNYIDRLYKKEKQDKVAIIFSYITRFIKIILDRSDFIIIEKELFPYLPYFLERLCLIGKRYIIDIDDAVFHNYDINKSCIVKKILGNKFKKLFSNSFAVTAGSPYLVDYAILAGARNVIYYPTVIDLDKYSVTDMSRAPSSPIIIGWIGTNQTAKYVELVIPILEQLALKVSQPIQLYIIGSDQKFTVKNFEVKNIEWSEDNEVDLINNIDIGIMPLINTKWEEGKCAYKLIQYMGCAKPVVATKIGANNVVVDHGVNGFLCESDKDWYEYIEQLVVSEDLRLKFGQQGRLKVESMYSIDCNIKILKQVLESR